MMYVLMADLAAKISHLVWQLDYDNIQFLPLKFPPKIYGVAISTFFHRGLGCFVPSCGRMAAQPKLNLCLSSSPTAAAAERMNH